MVFVDRNCLQLDDFTEEMMAMEPYAEKWKAFGWNVMEVDGHDMEQLVDAIDQLPAHGFRYTYCCYLPY